MHHLGSQSARPAGKKILGERLRCPPSRERGRETERKSERHPLARDSRVFASENE